MSTRGSLEVAKHGILSFQAHPSAVAMPISQKEDAVQPEVLEELEAKMVFEEYLEVKKQTPRLKESLKCEMSLQDTALVEQAECARNECGRLWLKNGIGSQPEAEVRLFCHTT